MNDLKILIADDHPILLKGLEALLREKGFSTLWTAGDGQEALEIIERYSPDLAILDIKMPGKSGIEIARICRNQHPDTKIIFLSYHADSEFIELSKTLNIKGFIPKENSTMEIERCIRSVSAGELYFPSDKEVHEPRVGARELIQTLDSMTPAQRKVLELISQGLSSREISNTLGITERTVEKHRSNIVQKLEIDYTQINLNQWALENGDFLQDYF